MNYFRLFIIIPTLLIIVSCASAYPGTLDENPQLDPNTSIILLSIEGDKQVNYLQYCLDSPPCRNYRFPAMSNQVVALRIPSKLSGVTLGTYTVESNSSGYLLNGVSFGYISVENPSFDVPTKGIYVHGTLYTDTNTFSKDISQESLKMAYQKYGSILRQLEPINFHIR